ncbi:MFS transporter [Caenimonas sedimenti]|uniref:MFS transporter n=1 Tax=Caenimonas sedimenti TaxID=2596921 RepID=UPI0021047CD7|nr:MFS transporter [Caenimonas sedimenti]
MQPSPDLDAVAATPPAGNWSVLLVTLAIQALVSMAVLAVPAMGPAFAQAMGAPPALLGAYIGVVYLGAMAASLAAAPLVLRFGALRTSQAALVLCALGMALPALWPSLPAAAVGAFLTGLGYGPVTPASSHLLARTTPPHRASLVFSIKQTGVPLGGVLAGVFVPGLALAGGAPSALLTVAGAALACALVAQPFRAALDGDRDPGQPLRMGSVTRGLRLVAAEPALKRLALVSFVFSIAQMSFSTYLVTYLTASLGYTLVAAGVLLSAAQAGGVAGRIAWGWVADRWLGAYRMLAWLAGAMALCAAGTAVLQAGAPQALTVFLLMAFGASAIGWNGVYLAEVARCSPPGQASAATGGTLAVTFFGVVLGPMLFGVVSGAFDSYRAGFAALALPTAACAWVLWRVAARGRQPA